MQKEILVAIIAASSALAGVIISATIALLLSIFDKKHKKQVLLREKYEEMMFHFSASLVWIQSLNGSTTQKEVLALSQSTDARKALSLCLLYFPTLSDAANNYIFSQQEYYASVVTSYRAEIPFTAGAQALVHNKDNHQVATDNLFNRKNIFENLIVTSAPRYTNA
jgi:hypothetical protein